MNTQNFSPKKYSIFLSLIYFAFVFQICCASESEGPVPKESIDRLKKIYEYDKWAGKVKDPNKRIDKLEIDPNFFDSISKKHTIFTNTKDRERQLDLNIIDKNTGLEVSIDICVANDPIKAHNTIINHLSLITAPPPVFKMVDANDPNTSLNKLGDVCFIPISQWIPEKSKKQVIRTILFCRNNVSVTLRNSNDETKSEYPDLGEIARLIDKKLIAISKTKGEKK